MVLKLLKKYEKVRVQKQSEQEPDLISSLKYVELEK